MYNIFKEESWKPAKGGFKMQEITKTVYVSNDGKEFLLKSQCEQHEKFLEDTVKVKQAYIDIINYCAHNCNENIDEYCNAICGNYKCPFYDEHSDYNCIFNCYPYTDFPTIEDL